MSSNEVATRTETAVEAAPEPTPPPSPTGALRLVEWAQEAKAAHSLATSLCATPFAGSFAENPGAATAAILRGAELGLTPVTSLSAFDLIQGQPAAKAVTLRALAQSAGHDIEVIEVSDLHAVARYRRKGRADWLTCEFTIKDARRLGLANKDNWKRQPKAMLEARVTSKAARLVASDVLLGIAYSAEELRDEPAPETVRPRVTAAEIVGAADGDYPNPETPDAEDES